ncbi:MAG: hypothetical protein GXP55_05510 [Deltaproteobacteria bacterium]|nr:hypothetical protein [Deltaproteobacteria bacterium]
MERSPSYRHVTSWLAVAVLLAPLLLGVDFAAAQSMDGFQIEVDGESSPLVPEAEPSADDSGGVAEDQSGAVAQTSEGIDASDPATVSRGEDAQARALFEAGTAYYDRGEYHDAYDQFVRSYEISRRPVLMYNASQAAERAGDLENAILWLERFVAAPDAELADRERQRPRLANLRHRLETRRIAHHADDEDHGFFMPVPAFIAYLVGGAGLLTFATFGILTLHEDSSLSDTCSSRACTSGDLSNLHAFARTADAGWIIGVAGVATGTILWLTLKGDSEEHEGVAFEPWLSPRLVGGSARLNF